MTTEEYATTDFPDCATVVAEMPAGLKASRVPRLFDGEIYITIAGRPSSGKTTLACLIRRTLVDAGFETKLTEAPKAWHEDGRTLPELVRESPTVTIFEQSARQAT